MDNTRLLFLFFVAVFAVVYTLYRRLFVARRAAAQRLIAAVNMYKLQVSLAQQLQKHRGRVSAVLGGDKQYSGQLERLGKNIEGNIQQIAYLLQYYPDLLEAGRWHQQRRRWNDLRKDWQGMDFETSFQQHSLIIEDAMTHLRYLGEAQGWLVSDTMYQQALGKYVLITLPKMAETVAQIRGLGVNTVVSGECGAPRKARLSQLLANINQFRQVRLVGVFSESHQEILLDQMANMINRAIIEADKPTIKSDDVFLVTTTIINNYWQMVVDGLEMIRSEQHRK